MWPVVTVRYLSAAVGKYLSKGLQVILFLCSPDVHGKYYKWIKCVRLCWTFILCALSAATEREK